MKCNYFVVYTGYTDRIIKGGKYHNNFMDYCEQYEHRPLFITEHCTNPDGREDLDKLSHVNNIFIHRFDNDENNRIADEECQRIVRDSRCGDGCIVLKVDTVENGLNFCHNLSDTDYCAMYDYYNFRMINHENDIVDIVYIVMDSESG